MKTNYDEYFGDGRGFLGNKNYEIGKSELNYEFEWEKTEPEYEPDEWFEAIQFTKVEDFPIGSICYMGNPDLPLIVTGHDLINNHVELQYKDSEALLDIDEWDEDNGDSKVAVNPKMLKKYKYQGIKMHIDTGAIISIN